MLEVDYDDFDDMDFDDIEEDDYGDEEDYEEEEDEDKYKPEITIDDLDEVIDGVKIKKNDDRITAPILTKYEKTKVLGFRALQISLGAEPKVISDEIDSYKLAELELNNKLLSLKIRRFLNKNVAEDWDINELIDVNIFT